MAANEGRGPDDSDRKPVARGNSRLRLPRALHLRLASDFLRVKNEGISHPGKLMIINVLPHPGPARIGIITSRRVGNAVTRNRVRRRLREIVRLNYRRIAADFWMVLIARQAAAKTSYALLEQEWLRLAERTSILKS